MNPPQLSPKNLTSPKSAKASRKNLHLSPMMNQPTPFQNGVQKLYCNSEKEKQMWMRRAKLNIKYTPVPLLEKDYVYIQNGEESLIGYLKKQQQRAKVEVLIEIIKTIKILGDIYGFFYIDSQMMKVSKSGKPLIWIHHHFKLNYRQFPIEQNQYAEKIFCDNTKRAFGPLIQFPKHILGITELIDFIDKNPEILRWKTQRTTLPKNVPTLNRVTSNLAEQRAGLQHIKSSQFLTSKSSSKKSEVKKIQIKKNNCSNFLQSKSKINDKSKNYDNQSTHSVKGKKSYLDYSESLSSRRLLSDKIKLRDGPQQNEHSSNTSKNFNTEVGQEKMNKQNYAIAPNKLRKQSENLEVVRDWISLHSSTKKFPNSTFSTRITCDTEAEEKSPELKNNKELVQSHPSCSQPKNPEVNLSGHKDKNRNRKWKDNYGTENKINWGIESQIAEQDDSIICEEMDKLFDSDLKNKQEKKELKQSELAKEFDELFQCGQDLCKNSEQNEEDIIKDFQNVLI